MALNKNSGGRPGAAAVASSLLMGAPLAEGAAAAQRWTAQRDALTDACALPVSPTPSAQSRRRVAAESGAQIAQLLDDVQKTLNAATTTTTTAAAKATTAAGGGVGNGGESQKKAGTEKKSAKEEALLVRTLAEASSAFFRTECGLEVKANELRVCEDGKTASDHVHRRLQPLQSVLQALKEICPSQTNNKRVASSGKSGAVESTTTAITTTSSSSFIPSIVQSLQDAVGESMRVLEGGYANCATSAGDIAAWGEWIQPLLRLLQECMRMVPLERVVEEPRERLRRVTFDVKEKQREQEDAVTDGDMVRSEHVYFEKVALLESMRPLYEQLEQAVLRYKEESADEPIKKICSLGSELTRCTVPPVMERDKSLSTRCQEDRERLQTRRAEILAARRAQRNEFSVYMTDWEKCFQLNQQQQDACLKAIEELEQRLSNLSEERTFLVEDRLEFMLRERQLEEDAMAFVAFADQQECVLGATVRHLEQSAFCTQRIAEAVRLGYQQLNRHYQQHIAHHAESCLLDIRKERLEQFRGLYLTLGELQFKKERHVEELDKRIEYYHVQQELAMDTFNPKAKEYCKAKRELLEVKEAMNEQIQMIARKAEKQLEEFRPTELLLQAAGVSFRHPKDDLAEMNARKAQKLLEYHSLMSTMGGGEEKENSGGGDAKGPQK